MVSRTLGTSRRLLSKKVFWKRQMPSTRSRKRPWSRKRYRRKLNMGSNYAQPLTCNVVPESWRIWTARIYSTAAWCPFSMILQTWKATLRFQAFVVGTSCWICRVHEPICDRISNFYPQCGRKLITLISLESVWITLIFVADWNFALQKDYGQYKNRFVKSALFPHTEECTRMG